MQAAAQRSPKRAASFIAPFVSADDAALLDALPISASVIIQAADGSLDLCAYNKRFEEITRLSTIPDVRQLISYCVSGDGLIARHLRAWFDGEGADELDFRDGSGVAARFYRMRLAPLPASPSGERRCLVSVVARTVEVQAERTLRAEMLRDSLTGLPNRLAFTEMIEGAGSAMGDEQGGRDPGGLGP